MRGSQAFFDQLIVGKTKLQNWQSYSEENDIVIEDADSVKYYLLLTGRYSVDMAMKLETEEIVYAIVR